MHALLRGLAVAFIVLGWGRSGSSAPPPVESRGGVIASRLVLYAAREAHPLLSRVVAELHAQGFQVALRPSQGRALSVAELQGAADQAGAAAAAFLVVTSDAIEVSLVDRVRWQSSHGRVPLSDEGLMGAVAASQTAELLRAHLVDLPDAPHTDSERDAVTQEPAGFAGSPERASAQQWAARLSVGAAFSPGGLHAQAVGAAGVCWYPLQPLGAELALFGALAPAEAAVPEGELKLRFTGLGIGAVARPWPAASLAPQFAAGVEGFLIRSKGVAAAGVRSGEDTSVAFGPYLRLGVRSRVHSGWGVRGDVQVTQLVPEYPLRVDERVAKRFGAPLLTFALGIDTEF